jgi:hypothetical protein
MRSRSRARETPCRYCRSFPYSLGAGDRAGVEGTPVESVNEELMDADNSLYAGLQPQELYCIHGTAPYLTCGKCLQEKRDRENHEMLRLSFEHLASVLEKLERKL